jgi:predicted P-loop ATPase
VVDQLDELQDFRCDRNGVPFKDDQYNVKLALQKLGVKLRHNTFANTLPYTWGSRKGELDDAVVNDLWLAVDKAYRFRPQYLFFSTVVDHLARQEIFHPVVDYLAGLTWDGEERLDRWLVTYGNAEDSEYVRAVGRLTLLAAVRRVRSPGCKFDELPILESPQGFEKSTAIASLCPQEGLFSDSLPLGADAKLTIEKSTGVWIFEAGELHSKGKRDIESLKAALSRQVDGPVRLAYGRRAVSVPRQFITIGTTNQTTGYLTDGTGNRRFWPVAVGRFNIPALRADRDQLWAEAAQREALGESIRLERHLWPVAATHQEARRLEDPWEEVIEPLIQGVDKIPSSVLWDALGKPEVVHRLQTDNFRLGAVMQHFGFKNQAIWLDGKSHRGYVKG